MTTRLTSLALAVFVSLLALAVVPLRAQDKTNLSGAWTFTVQTDAGTGEPTVTLKQEGEKLTGHYSSQTLGEADLTGTVKGAKIDFTFTANVQGNALPVSYTGTVESATSMKGTLSITGLGNGTFTAVRK